MDIHMVAGARASSKGGASSSAPAAAGALIVSAWSCGCRVSPLVFGEESWACEMQVHSWRSEQQLSPTGQASDKHQGQIWDL